MEILPQGFVRLTREVCALPSRVVQEEVVLYPLCAQALACKFTGQGIARQNLPVA